MLDVREICRSRLEDLWLPVDFEPLDLELIHDAMLAFDLKLPLVFWLRAEVQEDDIERSLSLFEV